MINWSTIQPLHLSADLWDVILERIPHNALNAILRKLNIPHSRGLVNIKELAIPYLMHESNQTRALEFFNYYCSHVLFGNKKILFFNFNDRDLIDRVRQKISQYPFFSQSYNGFSTMLYPNNQLPTIADQEGELVAALDEGDQIHLVFKTIRRYNSRTTLSPTGDFRNYYELIGILRHYNQCFDVLTIHQNGYIDLKIDFYKKAQDNRKLSSREFSHVNIRIKDRFTQLMNVGTQNAFSWVNPLNLKSKLNSLVSDDAIQVCKVKQLDDQGSQVAFENESIDVRSSTTWLGSSSALQEVGDEAKPYFFRGFIASSLADYGYRTELNLDALPIVVQDDAGRLDCAIITGNLVRQDYNILREKLVG
ncbi:MAG: hypothetical protein WAT29_19510 [Thiolinea sp.]